jgi:glucose-1-phosphate thymidylyltransferase
MTTTKGILLAGGFGTRLAPLTTCTSKQLLPLYRKPVICYPLQTLKDLSCYDVLIIAANEEQKSQYIKLLGDGSRFGMNLSYIIQEKPNGLAEAFILGAEHCKDADKIYMMLGDNVILGVDWVNKYVRPNTIFTYKVKNPEQYGVVTTDEFGNIDKIVEKPKEFVSNDAVIGLYCFSSECLELAKKVKPSARGELEIVDLIKLMNDHEGVTVDNIDEGFWFDIGDHESLLDCANLIRTIDKRANHVIGIAI